MKPKCLEVMQRAYLFLDGEGLSVAERLEIEAHLEDCEPCLERVGIERETILLISQRLRHATPCPDGLKQKVAALLERA